MHLLLYIIDADGELNTSLTESSGHEFLHARWYHEIEVASYFTWWFPEVKLKCKNKWGYPFKNSLRVRCSYVVLGSILPQPFQIFQMLFVQCCDAENLINSEIKHALCFKKNTGTLNLAPFPTVICDFVANGRVYFQETHLDQIKDDI